MGITAAIGSAVVGGVIGNQQKQKAKGQAGQIERDSQAAQDAADAKLKQQHQDDILAQSQAGAVARKALGGTLDNTPSAAAPVPPKPFQPIPPTTLLTQPVQRKALIGQ